MTVTTEVTDPRCQFHGERQAVARLSTQSAADTPIVRDLCIDCIQRRVYEHEAFGKPPGEEIHRLKAEGSE